MSSWGVKIARENTNISSSNPNDYKYWSRYNGLTLVDTVEITFNAEGSQWGTKEYSHELDYTPFVFVKYTDTSFSNTLLSNNEVLPLYFSDGISEGGTITAYDEWEGSSFTPIFTSLGLTYRVDDSKIYIDWSVDAFEGGGGFSGYFTNWSVRDIEFTVTADIYSFQLGRSVS